MRPAAGFAIALRCTMVIRGGKKPLVVDVTSNLAEESGIVVPMPTFCADPINEKLKTKRLSINLYMLII
jgi:hypothetical protein